MIFGESREHLNKIVDEVLRLGAEMPTTPEVDYEASPRDMVLPDDFYSTTNHPTSVFIGGEWVEAEGLMMDKQIVVDPVAKRAWCKPISLVKRGDLVARGERGVKIKPPERPREGVGVFEFMNGEVSP